LAIIDGIVFGAKEAHAVLVQGIMLGIPAEDSESIVIGADSLDPEDIVDYGLLTTRYQESVLRDFAYNLLNVLDVFIDAEPVEDKPEPEPEPEPEFVPDDPEQDSLSAIAGG
jgi:hypothetical protein